jgi:NitT/TauT family transport system substrate-binding protein
MFGFIKRRLGKAHATRSLKSLFYLLLFALTTFWVVACSPQQSTTSTASAKTLTVGISPWPGYSAHWVAMANDLFKAEGVEVKEVPFASQSDSDTAFLAGKLDLNWTGLPNAVPQISRDPAVKVIFQCDYSNGSDGILGRNIKSKANVKGQKIARENILIEELLLRKYLKSIELTREDVTTIDLSAADSAAAFTADKVDIAVTYEPWMTKAAKDGKGEIIFTSKDSNIIPDGVTARENTIQDASAAIQAYLRAIDKAVALIKEKPDEVKDIIAKNLAIKPEEVAGQLAGVKLYNVEMNKTITFNASDPMNLADSMIFASKTAKEMKLIEQEIDVPAALSDSVVKAI